ncbi:DUF4178 domain-containing protein [Fulvivirga sp. RKSG066]|uniref:DUF4178 domain-containing protein n=1 Tax=Fulvivirga aurantia TaxID=2529383 RepID=UPI0012BC98DE|nr:DUF4178 domain-containing protein [Fulvivirga aurantia]MTI20161.1 DUF4178 domain-containing protein [Fulvivirga aurantia]
MGLFGNLFSKKEEEPKYDSTNIRIQDLDVGFVFEYDLATWEVQEAYEYDWGDNYFTQEYKISDGSKTLFLSVEEDDEMELSLSTKLKVRELGDNVLEELMNKQKPPSKITYQDTEYLLEEEAPGYFHDCAKPEDVWEEFIAWDFADKSGEKIITIEQWDEREFEASAGKTIKEFEISNILPATR